MVSQLKKGTHFIIKIGNRTFFCFLRMARKTCEKTLFKNYCLTGESDAISDSTVNGWIAYLTKIIQSFKFKNILTVKKQVSFTKQNTGFYRRNMAT